MIRCMSIKLQGNRSCHFPAYNDISLGAKKKREKTPALEQKNPKIVHKRNKKKYIDPAIERASNENIKVTLHSKP